MDGGRRRLQRRWQHRKAMVSDGDGGRRWWQVARVAGPASPMTSGPREASKLIQLCGRTTARDASKHPLGIHLNPLGIHLKPRGTQLKFN
eukprot:15454762-Alexandrium_andersonii.AAC.1